MFYGEGRNPRSVRDWMCGKCTPGRRVACAALRETGVLPTGPSPVVRRPLRADGRAGGARGRVDSDENGPRPQLTISFFLTCFWFSFRIVSGDEEEWCARYG